MTKDHSRLQSVVLEFGDIPLDAFYSSKRIGVLEQLVRRTVVIEWLGAWRETDDAVPCFLQKEWLYLTLLTNKRCDCYLLFIYCINSLVFKSKV